MRQGKNGPMALDKVDDRSGHFGGTMTEDHWPESQQIVDVDVPVSVLEPRTASLLGEDRMGIPARPDRTGSAVHAAGDQLGRLAKKLRATRISRSVPIADGQNTHPPMDSVYRYNESSALVNRSSRWSNSGK